MKDLRNSHIFSEFLYDPLYDGIHRFHVMPTDPTARETLLQKGLREYLLCENCEQRIGRWENYAKTAFVEGKGIQATQHQGAIWLRNLDYRKLKLFQLSMLWRMGVTRLEFFQEVELGPHEERIRLALLNEDPLTPDEYPCKMVAVEIEGKPYLDWILPPSMTRLGAYRVYWLVINGIMYHFFVGSCRAEPDPIPTYLNAKGEILVPVVQAADIPCLRDALRSIARAHKARAWKQ